MGIVKTLLGNAVVVVVVVALAATASLFSFVRFFSSAIQFRCSHSFLPHICRGFTELSSPCSSFSMFCCCLSGRPVNVYLCAFVKSVVCRSNLKLAKNFASTYFSSSFSLSLLLNYKVILKCVVIAIALAKTIYSSIF